MEVFSKQEGIEIRPYADAEGAFEIAKKLPDFFDGGGLKKIAQDTKDHILYGAYFRGKMVGFVTYKEVNPETVEMSWLGVVPEQQGSGVGTTLVNKSLEELSSKYKVCEVKTLSEADPYDPYKKTRAFYTHLGFVPIETINPYPGWGDNPCQIFVKFIGKQHLTVTD